MKITLVDDNPMIVTLVEQILEFELDVVLTNGGCDAAALMREDAWRDVDVAVVDLLLPGMTGDVLLDWLAEHAPHVRRVALSAAGPLRLEQVQNAHARLLKPFMIDDFLDALYGAAVAGRVM